MVTPSPELNPPDESLDVLCVAAHPDDAELSVGGTLIKAAAEGLRTGVLDLTTGEPTPRGDLETRARETAAATEALNLLWRGNLGLPNRSLTDDLAYRRRLAEAFRRLRPRLVLAHHPEDVHPDHVAAAALVDGARFWGKLSRSDMAGEPFFVPQVLSYWSVHLRTPATPSVVVDISEHIEAKTRAVTAYQSQLGIGEKRAFPTVVDDMQSRARHWGWSIHAAYGEPLLCREVVPARTVGAMVELWS